METRNIEVGIELARKLYNSEDDAMVELALQAFSKRELEGIEQRNKVKETYPKSIEEFKRIHPEISGGFFINSNNLIIRNCDTIKDSDYIQNHKLNLIKSLGEAEAIQNLIALRLIRKVSYVKDWERNLDSSRCTAFCLMYDVGDDFWKVERYDYIASLFSFPTNDMAEEFYNNFKRELNLIKPLFK